MSIRSLAFAIALALIVSPSAFAGYRISSWIVGYDPNSLASTETNAGRMTESNPVWYEIKSDGSLTKTYNSEDPTWRAAMTGTEILPTVQNLVNGSFNKSVAVSVISTPSKRETHSENIRRLVRDQAYDGIDIDYEVLPYSSRSNFTAFVTLLAEKLHSDGKKLSVTVYAQTTGNETWDGAGAQDYAAIGSVADSVKIMIYPYHYSGTSPGPLCPLDWLDKVLTFAKSKIAASKIVAALPWYGKEWVGTTAKSITYNEAMTRATANNATITHPAPDYEATFKYSDKTVFFNDAFAYNKKVDLIQEKHPAIGGIGHWVNGSEDPGVWNRVESLKNGTTPTPSSVPGAPDGLTASSPSASAVNLAWTDNAIDESGFRVERCTGTTAVCDASPVSYAQIAQVGANVTSYSDSGLASSTTYSYRVLAYNGFGNSSYSNSAAATTGAPPPPPPPVTGSTLIAPGAVWRYLDNGSDQATAWRSSSFDDGGWRSGAAQLGYGDGDERTVVSYGPSADNKFATTYFRYAFTLENPAAYSSLTLKVLRDDGAVVYLNGTEVFRSNMPTGTIGYRSWASGATPDESTFFQTTVNPLLLVSGINVVAVEVHQSDQWSSDISFDLELTGTMAPIPAPTNLTASAPSSARIDLAWTDNAANESGFRVERCTGTVSTCDANPTSFTQIAQLGPNATSYGDSGLASSTTYSYRVRAYDANGTSNYSNTAAATTLAPPPPAAPSSLVAVPTSHSQINLSWTDNSFDENGFRIERCTGPAATCDGSTAWSQITEAGANVTTYSDSGLASITTYTYRVRSFNSGGNSAYTPSAAATTLAPPPPPPGPVTFISRGSGWKYLDNGSDQGVAWQALSFNDGAWKNGTAQLGYGDGDEVTAVSYGPSSSQKFVTTYFRRAFNVTDPAALQSLLVKLMRDDGAVVFLNGTEIWRSNMPTGTIGYRTYASTALVPPEESTFYEKTITPSLLVTGTNVIAVEIHQSDAGSSDISFDFELIGN